MTRGNRSIVAALVGAAVVLGVTACAVPGIPDVAGTSSPDSVTTASLTLVLPAATAVLDGSTLVVPSGRVTWIADRPDRASGGYSSDRLAALWDWYGFAADPPNVVLTGTSPHGLRLSIPLELTSPEPGGDGALRFGVTPLPGTAATSIELTDATLVVDSTGSAPMTANLQQLTAALQSSMASLQNMQSDVEGYVASVVLPDAMQIQLVNDITTAIDSVSAVQSQVAALTTATDEEASQMAQPALEAMQALQSDVDDLSDALEWIQFGAEDFLNDLLSKIEPIVAAFESALQQL